MTPRQAAILAYLRTHPRASYREIAWGCEVSAISVVRYNVRKLAVQGKLTLGGTGKARSIEITDPAQGDAASALAQAARLLVERADRLGGYGVVPWAAVEALKRLI